MTHNNEIFDAHERKIIESNLIYSMYDDNDELIDVSFDNATIDQIFECIDYEYNCIEEQIDQIRLIIDNDKELIEYIQYINDVARLHMKLSMIMKQSNEGE